MTLVGCESTQASGLRYIQSATLSTQLFFKWDDKDLGIIQISKLK